MIAQTYHEVLPADLVTTLSRRYSLTALYLRGRADQVAIHRSLPLEFEFEVKTHRPGKWHDLTLEALPFLHHLLAARLGKRCLYIYRDYDLGLASGFWVHRHPPFRCLYLPDRWGGFLAQRLRRIFQSTLPGVPIIPLVGGRGSGDPFLVVDQTHLSWLSTWKYLVDRVLDAAERLQRIETSHARKVRS